MAKEPSRLCVDEVRLGLDMLRLWMKNNVYLLMNYCTMLIHCYALSVKKYLCEYATGCIAYQLLCLPLLNIRY
jgi:hypothetical protein